ncbi:hypothetical protein F5I97DRAFT_1937881 [Phlebopus sp. FC_14]|nr:hypothetical protein F5I97DRAFT_1937881 [Phlebopus sp. FC_14]
MKISIPPLDPSLYTLSPEEATFFKGVTGIHDDEALKAHILKAQERAYKVAPYPCIYGFGFLRMAITKHTIYDDIIKIGRERGGAILLDIGSCFGVDARKAAADGFPARNIVASDLMKGKDAPQEFLDLSYVLFNTTKETYPGHFVAGDALDLAILSVVPPCRATSSPHPRLDLETLTSLNPLHGHCSVEKQLHLARALGGLLSPEPGSLICGLQVGAKEAGVIETDVGSVYRLFCHSPESWTSMWDGTVFNKGEVKVEATLHDLLGAKVTLLFWSVTRLQQLN